MKGFTLIELMIVFLLIGVLSAISMPQLFKQIAKARMSEAKHNLGTINRAQEAYYFEYAAFAGSMIDMQTLMSIGALNGSSFETKYFRYSISIPPTKTEVHHLATPIGESANDLKKITSAIFRDTTNKFDAGICEGDTVVSDPQLTGPDTCTDGKIIK